MSTRKTLDALEQELAEARRTAEEAQAKADERRAVEEAKRQERLRRYDQARLDAYDDEQLAADVAAAEERLRQAIIADPVYAAAIEVRVAGARRYHAFSEAQGNASRLGVEFRATTPPQGSFTVETFLQEVVEAEGSRRMAEHRHAVEQARIDAGERA